VISSVKTLTSEKEKLHTGSEDPAPRSNKEAQDAKTLLVPRSTVRKINRYGFFSDFEALSKFEVLFGCFITPQEQHTYSE
jgi:hypothetical protein